MGLLDSDAEELKSRNLNSKNESGSAKPGGGRKVNQSGLGAFKSLSKYNNLTAKYRTQKENSSSSNVSVEQNRGTLTEKSDSTKLSSEDIIQENPSSKVSADLHGHTSQDISAPTSSEKVSANKSSTQKPDDVQSLNLENRNQSKESQAESAPTYQNKVRANREDLTIDSPVKESEKDKVSADLNSLTGKVSDKLAPTSNEKVSAKAHLESEPLQKQQVETSKVSADLNLESDSLSAPTNKREASTYQTNLKNQNETEVETKTNTAIDKSLVSHRITSTTDKVSAKMHGLTSATDSSVDQTVGRNFDSAISIGQTQKQSLESTFKTSSIESIIIGAPRSAQENEDHDIPKPIDKDQSQCKSDLTLTSELEIKKLENSIEPTFEQLVSARTHGQDPENILKNNLISSNLKDIDLRNQSQGISALTYFEESRLANEPTNKIVSQCSDAQTNVTHDPKSSNENRVQENGLPVDVPTYSTEVSAIPNLQNPLPENSKTETAKSPGNDALTLNSQEPKIQITQDQKTSHHKETSDKESFWGSKQELPNALFAPATSSPNLEKVPPVGSSSEKPVLFTDNETLIQETRSLNEKERISPESKNESSQKEKPRTVEANAPTHPLESLLYANRLSSAESDYTSSLDQTLQKFEAPQSINNDENSSIRGDQESRIEQFMFQIELDQKPEKENSKSVQSQGKVSAEVRAKSVQEPKIETTKSVQSQGKVGAEVRAMSVQNETEVSAKSVQSEGKVSAKVSAKIRPISQGHLVPLDSIYSLNGSQKLVLNFVYDQCVYNNSLVTVPITKQQLVEATKLNEETALSAIKRLRKKQIIDRAEYKDGKGGWTRYQIDEISYKEVTHQRQHFQTTFFFDPQSGGKVSAKVSADASSKVDSNNIYITNYLENENAPTFIEDERSSQPTNGTQSIQTSFNSNRNWFKDLDFTQIAPFNPLQVNVGIRRLVEEKLEPEDVQAFLNRFKPWLATQSKIANPLGIFCDKLKEYANEGDSPVLLCLTEEERRAELMMAQEVEKLRQENEMILRAKELQTSQIRNEKFETWLATSTEADRAQLVAPTSVAPMNSIAYRILLKEAFVGRMMDF